MQREPSNIQPEPDGSNPFSFVRLVQPVLDANCVECHARDEKAVALSQKSPDGKSDGRGWSESYRSLQKYAFYYDAGDFVESKTYPGKFGALASPLYRLLEKGHYDTKLTADELRRITLWLDCNSDFYGTYEDLPAQLRGEIIKPVLQ